MKAHRVSGVTCCLPGGNAAKLMSACRRQIREGYDGSSMLESIVVRKGAVPTPICPDPYNLALKVSCNWIGSPVK